MLLVRGIDRAVDAVVAACRGASPHGLHRALARHPRRADDVRLEARRLGVRARPRPRTARARARVAPGRAALRHRRHLRRRSIPRSSGSPASGSGLEPDPVSTQVIARDRHAELLSRARAQRLVARPVRDRDPPPRAHRGARGRGAVRRRDEGLLGDAAQAQPEGRRADLRARARRPRAPRSSASRTCRSGTSATSRTPPPSASSSPTRSSRSTTCSTGSAGSSRASSSIPSGCARNLWRLARPRSSRTGCCSRWSSRASTRGEAYRLVQRNAMRAWDEERDFRELVARRPRDRGAPRPRRARRGLRPRRDRAHARRDIRPSSPSRPEGGAGPCLKPPPHLGSGKVRELYALDDERLLLVASDRISTFDVVLPTEIPDKGRVLTGLSGFWFARTSDLVPNHLLALRDDGRSTECRRLEMLPIECVVRGYLAGLRAGRTTSRPARSAATGCPSGLVESQQLPEPIFTPATKAQTGHDENIDRDGGGRARRRGALRRGRGGSRSRSTTSSPSTPRERGIILADTKLEFGIDTDGRLVLADEAFTPGLVAVLAGRRVRARIDAALVRQAVRARLLRVARLGQDRSRPRAARRRRRAARARATSRRSSVSPASPSTTTSPTRTWFAREGDGARPAEAGHPRPAGSGASRARCVTSASRSATRASDGSSTSTSRPTIATRRARSSNGCASSCSRTR